MKIYCIENNYFTDKRERESISISLPGIFIKPGNALHGEEADLFYESFEEYRWYIQSEVVLRISKNGRHISTGKAPLYYDAMTTGINLTRINLKDAREGKMVPWEAAKGFDRSSLIGKWFPAEFADDIHDIDFCLYNNREMVQIGNTELMIHDLNSIISIISAQHDLEAGDIIFTGTPAGLGEIFRGDELEAFWGDDSVIALQVGG